MLSPTIVTYVFLAALWSSAIYLAVTPISKSLPDSGVDELAL